jgi:hypothetical protein
MTTSSFVVHAAAREAPIYSADGRLFVGKVDTTLTGITSAAVSPSDANVFAAIADPKTIRLVRQVAEDEKNPGFVTIVE